MFEAIAIAFMIGLTGSSHCLAMCGGISAAIGNTDKPLKSAISYNLGRLTTYSLMGFLLGWLFEQASSLQQDILIYLRLFAGVLIIAMGCYIARWSMLLSHFERLFTPIWKLIQPYAAKTLTHNTPSFKFAAGMLWGWLPCGLVYSTLAWAGSHSEAYLSALLMFSFALGTFPAMLALSLFSANLRQLLQSPKFKILSALLLISYGIHTIYTGLLQL